MDTVLSLILLVSEILKILRAKDEAHFLKKTAFVTNKCLAQDAFGKCPRTTENCPRTSIEMKKKYLESIFQIRIDFK